MNDKNSSLKAEILASLPNGGSLVSVPRGPEDGPTTCRPEDLVAEISPEGNVVRIMLNLPTDRIRKYAEWMAKHGIMSRSATPSELDSVIRIVASSMHTIVDNFTHRVGSTLRNGIGGSLDDLPGDPSDLSDENRDTIVETIHGICFSKLMRSARERGMTSRDRIEVSRKIKDLLESRVDFSCILGNDGTVDPSASGERIKRISTEILDEVYPDHNERGMIFNFIEDVANASGVAMDADARRAFEADLWALVDEACTEGYPQDRIGPESEALLRRHGIDPAGIRVPDPMDLL